MTAQLIDHTRLSNDNHREERCKGFEHAGIILGGSAATEEAWDKEDDATNDEEDGAVGVALVNELQEILNRALSHLLISSR